MGKLEKKAVFSPYCGDETTTYVTKPKESTNHYCDRASFLSKATGEEQAYGYWKNCEQGFDKGESLGKGWGGFGRGGETFLQKGFPAPPNLLFPSPFPYTSPLRAAMSSATMETAISSGVSAPISSPMGLWTRPKSPSEKPSERRKL